ncbi:MAG: hypothetical protein QXN93_00005, partial [Methanomassiliicoccales archaeon]
GYDNVICKKVDSVTLDELKSADVWIFGTPTHVGGATGALKRTLKSGIKSATSPKLGTAFDTRFAQIRKGGAQKIQKIMESAGINIIVPPEWFIVEGMKGPLAHGEESKAVSFGRKIAGALRTRK